MSESIQEIITRQVKELLARDGEGELAEFVSDAHAEMIGTAFMHSLESADVDELTGAVMEENYLLIFKRIMERWQPFVLHLALLLLEEEDDSTNLVFQMATIRNSRTIRRLRPLKKASLDAD